MGFSEKMDNIRAFMKNTGSCCGKIIKKIFCLPPLPTVLIAIPSFVFVFLGLALGLRGILSYVSYILSAYAMVITCTGFTKVVESVKSYIANHSLTRKIMDIPVGNRFLSDIFFRTEVFLYPGLFINLLYAGIKLFSGIYYRSIWFGALAVYYILLAVMRCSLIHAFREHSGENDRIFELRRSRFCGISLLIMNQALGVIVISVVYQNRRFDYPGILIYAMALYSFYALISAITGFAKTKKHGSPILSATKVIKLTAALVSMLSLETAMLSRFGGDGNTDFNRAMTGASGAVVCVLVLGMAVGMIIKSSVEIKRIKNDNPREYSA